MRLPERKQGFLTSRILVLISRRSVSGVGGWGGEGGTVNALPTGRRGATKEATAYSKATVQLLSHAKHSSVLCKGWAGRELREGLSHEGHLKHTDKARTTLSDAPRRPPILNAFLCVLLWWESVTKMPGLAESLLHLSCPLKWSRFYSS